MGGGLFLGGAFLKGPKGAFFRGGVLKVGRKYRRTIKNTVLTFNMIFSMVFAISAIVLFVPKF